MKVTARARAGVRQEVPKGQNIRKHSLLGSGKFRVITY